MRPLIIAALTLVITSAACNDGYGDDDESAQTATVVVSTATVDAPTAVASPTITIAESGLYVIDLSHGESVLRVEVAATAEARRVGLSNRESMDEDAGMLFDLEEARIPSFSMRDTLIPLDFVWVYEDMRVQGIVPDVQPVAAGEPLVGYSPTEPVRYVLELNGGTAARLGIEAGDQFEFVLP